MDPIKELNTMIKEMNESKNLPNNTKLKFRELLSNYKHEECWSATFEQLKKIMDNHVIKKEARTKFTNLFEDFYKDYETKNNKKPIMIPKKKIENPQEINFERKKLLEKHKNKSNAMGCEVEQPKQEVEKQDKSTKEDKKQPNLNEGKIQMQSQDLEHMSRTFEIAINELILAKKKINNYQYES